MSDVQRKEVSTFAAESADGQVTTVHVLQDFHTVRTRGGASEAAGTMYLRTSDGRTVNRIDKGKYEVVGYPKVQLTSDDPEAI